NTARKNLDWAGMENAALDPGTLCRRREAHKNEEVCAMCGKFCSVRMMREGNPSLDAPNNRSCCGHHSK
ncbi:MAG: phosphomethylpyrimidine synthase ThiC, partial [Mailhella sp.]|nr:phosphomethylpyrimidine synthase ThiC [Mailhella sp.]